MATPKTSIPARPRVDVQRSNHVPRLDVAERDAIDRQQHAVDGEDAPTGTRMSMVASYQKMTLRTTVATRPRWRADRAACRAARSSSAAASASRPALSALSGRGRVTSHISTVTTKHVVQAKIAVQKFCASSLG